ncbi:hypothetical protein GH714_040540 [Hevea brasiliensis]|uniref:Uncharacterized protein n=1 Tax=Hevea brasiliensis TaxID=3981 RepID=A0A6A6MHR3_HEVBR|nr:hypothetical protein GH714_040540 [Hevea brasiliensis]
MGCSGSKFDSKAESVPTRLRPLLRRKFEEMRRRKHGLSLKDDGSATLSKKELLKFGVSDDDNSSQPQDVDHKSISSQEDHGLKVVPPPESVETAPKNKMDPNKVVETAPLPPAKPSKDVEHDQKAVEVPSPAGSPKESDESKKQKNIQQDCKDEDKEELKSRQWRQCPGSETKTKKKAKRRIRLRRVIPKGRPGAVRNLLNVKSCYKPACSGHDNGHLLDEKAVA